ncbi:MAG: hypothetical protein Q8M08_16490 [Bacteroidales bacterium]|nr:hypothetical protein [Bacteroidales bacterium]
MITINGLITFPLRKISLVSVANKSGKKKNSSKTLVNIEFLPGVIARKIMNTSNNHEIVYAIIVRFSE